MYICLVLVFYVVICVLYSLTSTSMGTRELGGWMDGWLVGLLVNWVAGCLVCGWVGLVDFGWVLCGYGWMVVWCPSFIKLYFRYINMLTSY